MPITQQSKDNSTYNMTIFVTMAYNDFGCSRTVKMKSTWLRYTTTNNDLQLSVVSEWGMILKTQFSRN